MRTVQAFLVKHLAQGGLARLVIVNDQDADLVHRLPPGLWSEYSLWARGRPAKL